MYAVELFFDSNLEDFVKAVWKEFHHQSISSYMYDIEELKPHLTLAVYNEVPENTITDLVKEFGEFFHTQKQLRIAFDSIGIFPVTRTCYLAPTITHELLQLHAAFHRHFERYQQTANPYYVPNKWSPHCTLATQLHEDKIVEAVQHSLSRFKPLQTEIIEIGLVEIMFDGAKCIRSRTVASVRLVK